MGRRVSRIIGSWQKKLRANRRILFRPFENMYLDMLHLLTDEIIVNNELADIAV